MAMHSTSAAALALGVSRNTLLRWFREGKITPVSRDRRGWRIFSDLDLDRIRLEIGEQPRSVDVPSRLLRMRRYLGRVTPLKSLKDEILDDLAAMASFRGYLSGQTIFHPGDRSGGLHILVKGKVRLSRSSVEGREQVLALITPYELLGEAGLFRPNSIHGSRALCVESSTLLNLPTVRLKDLMLKHPELSLAFLREFASRIESLERRLEELSLLSLNKRLSGALLNWAKEDGSEFTLPMSTAELASFLGGARESLSRCLVGLEKDGLIKREGRRVQILDIEGLEKM